MENYHKVWTEQPADAQKFVENGLVTIGITGNSSMKAAVEKVKETISVSLYYKNSEGERTWI